MQVIASLSVPLPVEERNLQAISFTPHATPVTPTPLLPTPPIVPEQ